MNIVVTGGAGFIGSHLCDRLITLGHSVLAIDNLSKGRIENLSKIINNQRFKFKNFDILHLEEFKKAANKVDIIFHLAAFKIPRYGNSLNTLKINSIGTLHALEIAKQNNCKTVIASTSDVYGKNTDVPFNEECDLVVGSSKVNRWSYSVSKIFDEHLSLAYSDEFGIPVTILRFFSSYGPRNHKDWWGGPQSVFIESILNGKPVEIHGDGLQTRTFCYIDDLINGIVSVINNDKTNNEIINLGSLEEIKIIDLAKKVNNLINPNETLNMRYISYNSFTGKKYEDVMRRVPDITKAKNFVNYNPETSLTEGLIKTIEWHKATRY